MNEVVASPVLEEPPIIGEAGEGFDVFSSSIGGSANEDFSTRIDSEATTAGADDFDLVAVAGGEEKLDTAMSDANSQGNSEKLTPVDPELCQNFGTIACVGCIFAQDCQRRQAEMMASNNEDQPEQLSTLEQLLQKDEDEEPGRIVWAQPTPDGTSREQPPAAEEDSSSTPEPESEPEPRPEFKPEEQLLADTQSPLRPSNKQKESAAATLPHAAESKNLETNHEVDESHGDDQEKSTTAHIANVVKKTTSSDDGSTNLEANSNLAAKVSKEPLVQIDSDNTNEYIRQDELLRAVDHVANDSDKLVNREAAMVNRATQTAQHSNKHADQEALSAVNTTEQISSVNTHQAIKIPKPEGNGSAVAATHSQKEPVIEKVSSTPIDVNDTLADSGTSTAVDRVVNRQESPALKPKPISTKNNLLKKTTPKNITTKPKSDSSTDFKVSAEMSLESQKTPSTDKQNPLADDKKDNISSPSAVESVDYFKKNLSETRPVNAVQNTSDGEDSAAELAEKESAPSKKAVVKNHNVHYSDSAFNQTKQVETVANTPAVKLPAEAASWASENEIFVVERKESFTDDYKEESVQCEVVPIDEDSESPPLLQNERAPKIDIERDLETKNATSINIQLQSDQSSGLLPKLDETVNLVLPPSRSLNSELLAKLDETSNSPQEHEQIQTSELWPKLDEASNQLINQTDFEDGKTVRQKTQQTRIIQPNEHETIYVDLRDNRANDETAGSSSEPTADFINQVEVSNDNDLSCQLDSSNNDETKNLHKVFFNHPLTALRNDNSQLNPENNKISNGRNARVASWLTKLVGAVAVYVACSRREGTLGISN